MNTYEIIIDGKRHEEFTLEAESMKEVVELLKEWAKIHRVKLSRYDIYRLRGGDGAEV